LKARFEEEKWTTAMDCHTFYKQHFEHQDNIKIMSYSTFIAFMNETRTEPLKKRHKQQLQMLLANSSNTQRATPERTKSLKTSETQRAPPKRIKSLKTLKSPMAPTPPTAPKSSKTDAELEGPKAPKAPKPLKNTKYSKSA
jgi:hypothetical protein